MIEGRTTERVVETRDPAGTRALAGALAAASRPGDLISLVGELGAGKTQFAKGFGSGLGITDTIVSPSFVLMAEYRGRLPLFHIDLYRLEEARQVATLGLEEIFDRDALVLIEWGERFPQLMPAERTEINIRPLQNDEREIEVRQVT